MFHSSRSFAVFVSMMLVSALGYGGCLPFEQPANRYPIISTQQLLLDHTAFPPGWMVNPCAPDCARAEGYGRAMRTFGRPGPPGHVIQEVLNYEYERSARGEFQRAKAINFTQSPLTYISPIADEYDLGCGVHYVPACQLNARYANYVISLYIDIDDGTGEGVPMTAVTPLLQALDHHIATQLHITLPPPT